MVEAHVAKPTFSLWGPHGRKRNPTSRPLPSRSTPDTCAKETHTHRESVMCWPATSEREACPRMVDTHCVIHWRELIFPLPAGLSDGSGVNFAPVVVSNIR